eukprot:10144265-Heterocapsa_arctica.AAC.1
MEAVQLHGDALRFASEELKSDRKVVMEAVKQAGSALQDASEELKGDREFVTEVWRLMVGCFSWLPKNRGATGNL